MPAAARPGSDEMRSLSPTEPSPDVVVVGGGAVGVCAALELAVRGAAVRLVERGPELAWGCSAGNAGIVGAGHVLPLAGPDALRDGLRWMGRPDSPFAIRPRPALMPWVAEFAAASRPARVREALDVLRPLALASARMHATLAAGGHDTGYRAAGLLNVYAGAAAFAEACRDAERDRIDGVAAEVLDAPALAERFPELAGTPAGGILSTDEAHCDPARFVHALGAAAQDAGVDIRTGVDVLGLDVHGAHARSLITTAGRLRAGEVVLAAGVWAPELVRGLPIRLPVEGGKGYHVDVDAAAVDPGLPVWFQEDRVVVTPMPGKLRIAGTLELGGRDHAVDLRRVDAVTAAWHRGLRGTAGRRVREVWRGLRPCTPDGLPLIGRAEPLENLTVASGHGMWGLQLAPVTGLLVAQLLTGEPTEHDLRPLSPARFRVPWRRPARSDHRPTTPGGRVAPGAGAIVPASEC
jgi:D-amino-acid dehydrogenase